MKEFNKFDFGISEKYAEKTYCKNSDLEVSTLEFGVNVRKYKGRSFF